jgi:hypothetical protein
MPPDAEPKPKGLPGDDCRNFYGFQQADFAVSSLIF